MICTVTPFFSIYSHFTGFLAYKKLCMKNRMLEFYLRRGLIVTTMCRKFQSKLMLLSKITDRQKMYILLRWYVDFRGCLISGRKYEFWLKRSIHCSYYGISSWTKSYTRFFTHRLRYGDQSSKEKVKYRRKKS
jgi:hypothetical protein